MKVNMRKVSSNSIFSLIQNIIWLPKTSFQGLWQSNYVLYKGKSTITGY